MAECAEDITLVANPDVAPGPGYLPGQDVTCPSIVAVTQTVSRTVSVQVRVEYPSFGPGPPPSPGAGGVASFPPTGPVSEPGRGEPPVQSFFHDVQLLPSSRFAFSATLSAISCLS